MNPEHRVGRGEFRVQGRVLSGVAMRYGDVVTGTSTSVSSRERSARSARVDVNLQHDPGACCRCAVLVLTDSPRELRVRADLPAKFGRRWRL